jgi:hypothetical protein
MLLSFCPAPKNLLSLARFLSAESVVAANSALLTPCQSNIGLSCTSGKDWSGSGVGIPGFQESDCACWSEESSLCRAKIYGVSAVLGLPY